MRRKPLKLALCLIVKNDKEESEMLRQCLQLSSQFVNKTFITITHKKDEKPCNEMLSVCNDFGCVVSEFEWINNFAKARNFNFSQVPKEYEYILWLDADDGVRGIDELIPFIKKHRDIDAFVMNYLYAFDEDKNPIVTHMKTQVVRNDGCVQWAVPKCSTCGFEGGELHEDFKPNRVLTSLFIDKIERIHLSKDTRFDSAKERNIKISENAVKVCGHDPRQYWNYGNSLKAVGRDSDAITAFDKFLEVSQSDEEKYIVRLRRAESYFILGKSNLALDECRYAIGLRPEYPDAYHLLGNLQFGMGKFPEAIKSYLTGLRLKPPYRSIIVFNPRDYDLTPMKNLAKALINVGDPSGALVMLEACLKITPKDEKLKGLIEVMRKEKDKMNKILAYAVELEGIKDKDVLYHRLQDLPDEFRSAPQICRLRNLNFVRENSTGKDISYYCGFTDEMWTPDTAKTKGIGGSEEAVIWLSKLWTRAGWNVTVYNNCGHKEQWFDGVCFKPFWMWNPKDKTDITILWRTPRMARYEINTTKLFVDLHDTIEAGEFTEERLNKIDKIFVKSKCHRNLYPGVRDDKFVIIPNGIDTKLFDGSVEKDNLLMVNTSSPDRSLSTLVELFEKVKREVPGAKCKWAYGWRVFDLVHGQNQKMMDWKRNIQEKMKDLGIEELGRVSHSDVAELYKKSLIFAYPSEFFEIDCISLSKAMAAGCVPITSDYAAMGEKAGHGGYFIKSTRNGENWFSRTDFEFGIKDEKSKQEWVERAVMTLKNPPDKMQLLSMKSWAKDTFDWDKVKGKWIKEFND